MLGDVTTTSRPHTPPERCPYLICGVGAGNRRASGWRWQRQRSAPVSSRSPDYSTCPPASRGVSYPLQAEQRGPPTYRERGGVGMQEAGWVVVVVQGRGIGVEARDSRPG